MQKKRNLIIKNIPLKGAHDEEKQENDEVKEFIYKPTITLSNLGGMDDVVKDLQETISNPLNYYSLHQELNVEPVKGILLCGPPGCGKTTLAYAIGGSFPQAQFFRLTAPQLVSSLSGESESQIRKLFNKVIESAPSILFIDEIESILGKSESAGKSMERRILAQIMRCIDDISLNSLEYVAPIFIIGATSKPELVDSSVRRSGRFDKEVHIGFPNQNNRLLMLKSLVGNKKIGCEVKLEDLAKMTPGYLAADLQSLIREAGRNSIKRIINQIELANVDKLKDKAEVLEFKSELNENGNKINDDNKDIIDKKFITSLNNEYYIEMKDFEQVKYNI